MSAEATSATGAFLLAQDVAKELLAARSRIVELEAQLEDRDRELELALARAERAESTWRR